jgi:hypothetical protein
MNDQTQLSLFSIQTVLGNNLPKEEQNEIIDQLAIILLLFLELFTKSDNVTNKEIRHVRENNI